MMELFGLLAKLFTAIASNATAILSILTLASGAYGLWSHKARKKEKCRRIDAENENATRCQCDREVRNRMATHDEQIAEMDQNKEQGSP